MFPLNTFENLCVFFLLLMIYSAAGWVGEMFSTAPWARATSAKNVAF